MTSDLACIPANARIATLYAQGLVDYLRDREITLDTLLPGSGLTLGSGAEETQEVSLADWIKLLDAATRELKDPALPARAGASLKPRHLGALGLVLMSCTTLQEAYTQLARYIRLLGQIGQPELSIDGDQATLIWKWPYAGDPPQSVALFMLAARVRFMRWLSDTPDLKVGARIHGTLPGPIEPFREIFGNTVTFEQPHSALRFPRSVLELPVVTADSELRNQAERKAQSLLQVLTNEPDILRQTKRVIVSRLASGRVAVEETARALHISGRTLQRHLRSHNLNYQKILDQVRAECATSLIRDKSIPMAEVAFLLGYRDQSTFNTAYRRWFSTSPGRDRKQQLGLQGA